jgi:ABC-type uncharacterized transport system substrate-binding protein
MDKSFMLRLKFYYYREIIMASSITKAFIFSLFCLLFFSPCHSVMGKELSCAIVLWRGETGAELGFKKRLSQLGYQCSFDLYNGEQDREILSNILRNELNPKLDEYDYVYTFGTTTSQMTKHILKQRVPQIFNIVTDPVSSRLVADMQLPGENISGVSNSVPLELQLLNAKKIINFQRLAVLFNSREENASDMYFNIKEISRNLGFEVVGLRSPSETDQLEINLGKLSTKRIDVDAVYLSSDSYLVSNAELIGSELRNAGIKSIGALEKYVKKGVALGTVADYQYLGRLAAEIIDRHQKGTPLGEIPVQRHENPPLVINKTTCDYLEISIPDKLLSDAVIVE